MRCFILIVGGVFVLYGVEAPFMGRLGENIERTYQCTSLIDTGVSLITALMRTLKSREMEFEKNLFLGNIIKRLEVEDHLYTCLITHAVDAWPSTRIPSRCRNLANTFIEHAGFRALKNIEQDFHQAISTLPYTPEYISQPAPSTFPWKKVVIGVGATVLVAGVVMHLVSRAKDEEKGTQNKKRSLFMPPYGSVILPVLSTPAVGGSLVVGTSFIWGKSFLSQGIYSAIKHVSVHHMIDYVGCGARIMYRIYPYAASLLYERQEEKIINLLGQREARPSLKEAIYKKYAKVE